MMALIGSAIYGVMSQDWQWMPRPDWNFLSWGFGFYIIHLIAALASGICFFLESKKVGLLVKYLERETFNGPFRRLY